jgi:hypothetical protein
LVEWASEAGIGAYLVKPPKVRELGRAIAMARFEDLMELRRLNAELQLALDRVRTLGDLLPICAACKKIRDDAGYWHQFDVFIRDRSDTRFSHGICPECRAELSPEFEFLEGEV